MPGPHLTDLTIPQHDTTTTRAVLNAWMRQLVTDFATLRTTWLRPANRDLLQRTRNLTQRLLKSNPRQFVPILRQPTIAAVLLCALQHSHPEGDHARLNALVRELCLLVLFELSAHGAGPDPALSISGDGEPWPLLRSLSANRLLELAPSVEAVLFEPAGVELRSGARTARPALKDDSHTGDPTLFRATRPYLPIVDGVWLALSDNNPLSDFEAHPDKQGNSLDLGGRDPAEWTASLKAAFELVDAHLPLLGQELRLVLRLLVPVGYEPEKHLSASYKEAVGTVYLTLHPNAMTMTEALIHEFQHNKLNAALQLDPLLHNGFSPLYTSPVRPDPRPLHGIVLAVHAFQPVARLYEKMDAAGHPFAANLSWQKRFRDVLRMIAAGAETVLTHAQPTEEGAPFFAELRALDAEFRAYEAAHWPEKATTAAPELPE